MADTEAIRAILRLRADGSKTDAVAEQLGISRNIVAKVNWEYQTQGKHAEYAPKQAVKPIIQFVPAPEKVPSIEEWEGVVAKSQAGEFRDTLSKLEHDKRYIVVEHDHDNHFPYHDPNAQSLRSKARQMVKPDLIVGGSDAFDFPSISRFEQDRRIPTGRFLSRVRPYWFAHVAQLNHDAPKAKKVYMPGNHCQRANETIEADENYDILMDYHVTTIKANDEFYWLGTGDDSLEILIGNALIVTHGTRANIHTAAATLDAYDRQYSVLAGHSHRPDYFTRGTKYKVSASIGGCGCLLKPHYDRRNAHSHWQHSYQYAVVDTVTETAIVNLVEFYHTSETIWCYVNGQVISVKKQALDAGQAAA